jgi:hypothetical protein
LNLPRPDDLAVDCLSGPLYGAQSSGLFNVRRKGIHPIAHLWYVLNSSKRRQQMHLRPLISCARTLDSFQSDFFGFASCGPQLVVGFLENGLTTLLLFRAISYDPRDSPAGKLSPKNCRDGGGFSENVASLFRTPIGIALARGRRPLVVLVQRSRCCSTWPGGSGSSVRDSERDDTIA